MLVELAVVFGYYEKDRIAAAGLVLTVLGAAIQFVLRGVCGSNAYEDCFENCPLPNPMKFNHNALFHLVYCLGVAVQIFGRYTSIHSQEDSNSSDGDDPNEQAVVNTGRSK